MIRNKCPYKENMTCVRRAVLTACKGCGDEIVEEGKVIMAEEQTNNLATLIQKKGVKIFLKCICWENIPLIKHRRIIQNYATMDEAYEDGWVYTNHIKFCPPGKVGQWVCPDCSQEHDWEDTREIYRAYDGRIIMHSGESVKNGI